MECISAELIERLFDSDLDDQERENIFSHLAECDLCTEKAMAFAAFEKGLIKNLTSLRKRSPSHLRKKEGCVSKKILLGYVVNGLPQAEMVSVETHLESCDACLKEMMRIQEGHLKEVELEFNTETLQRIPVSGKTSLIISLLEDIKKHIFEVVQTTGTVLKSPLPIEAVRGRGRIVKTAAIHIRKDFIDKGTSAEVTVKKGNKPDTYSLKLSLMNLEDNEITSALKSASVHLSGGGLEKEALTDNEGEVTFKNLPLGEYKIVLDSGIEVAINIQKT